MVGVGRSRVRWRSHGRAVLGALLLSTLLAFPAFAPGALPQSRLTAPYAGSTVTITTSYARHGSAATINCTGARLTDPGTWSSTNGTLHLGAVGWSWSSPGHCPVTATHSASAYVELYVTIPIVRPTASGVFNVSAAWSIVGRVAWNLTHGLCPARRAGLSESCGIMVSLKGGFEGAELQNLSRPPYPLVVATDSNSSFVEFTRSALSSVACAQHRGCGWTNLSFGPVQGNQLWNLGVTSTFPSVMLAANYTYGIRAFISAEVQVTAWSTPGLWTSHCFGTVDFSHGSGIALRSVTIR